MRFPFKILKKLLLLEIETVAVPKLGKFSFLGKFHENYNVWTGSTGSNINLYYEQEFLSRLRSAKCSGWWMGLYCPIVKGKLYVSLCELLSEQLVVSTCCRKWYERVSIELSAWIDSKFVGNIRVPVRRYLGGFCEYFHRTTVPTSYHHWFAVEMQGATVDLMSLTRIDVKTHFRMFWLCRRFSELGPGAGRSG